MLFIANINENNSRYVRKFRMLGHVDTAVIGRSYTCIAMHPHEELVTLKVLLQHPKKTLSEVYCTRCMKKQAQNMRVQRFFVGSHVVATPLCYRKISVCGFHVRKITFLIILRSLRNHEPIKTSDFQSG